MDNYGISGYGFMALSADAPIEETISFIRKHLPKEKRVLFDKCESIEDIEDVCSRHPFFDYRFNATGVLAYAIAVQTGQNVQLCGDDSGEDWIMLLPSYPWEIKNRISKEEFEKKAGELAFEFFGKPVRFSYHTTERWG